MGNDKEWEVTYFKVETITSGGESDSLYANGRMQVPVVVSIKAIEKDTVKQHTLQSTDLSNIKLIDYDDPTSVLSDGWSYGEQSINFPAHSLNTSVFRQTQAKAKTDVGPQSKKYWVSTTKIENKRVAARIKQSDGTTVTTQMPRFHSHVTLTGKEPIVYTKDNVEFVREDTANGSYMIKRGIEKVVEVNVPHVWDQDNYFVSSKVHQFTKADIYGYDTDGHANGHPGDSGLKNCYAYYAPDNKDLKLSYIWDFGAEATKKAGLYKNDTVSVVEAEAYAYADIKVNQKSNALCLTRLTFSDPSFDWGGKWSNDKCGFTVYDIYGNSGKFSASFTADHDLITLNDAN